jgi:hypothetical protein
MIAWIRKIHWGRIGIVAVIYTIVATIMRQLEILVLSQYFANSSPVLSWIGRMKSLVGTPITDLLITSLVATFLTGVSLSLIYCYLKEYLPKKKLQRIFFFADVLVAALFVFFIIPSYVVFGVPVVILGSWFISGFIVLLITSAAIVEYLS